MKLRCTNNSIRLRLRKSDIETLSKSNSIQESISFGSDSIFSYTLAITQESTLTAKHSEGNILVSIPHDRATLWINSNQVGIEENIPIGDKISLNVLVEKDFPCLDRDNEDKADTFHELAVKSDIC